MTISEIPIKDMTEGELKEFARALYKDGYSRISIFKFTDGRISERQIRKIYAEASKKPMLKAWHEENIAIARFSLSVLSCQILFSTD